ncbi:hypothetical protein HMPREF1608_02609 [Escherichia coli 908525]|nr:hypothetical protein HMPREF1608_02609 [Escherichia coli 908525]
MKNVKCISFLKFFTLLFLIKLTLPLIIRKENINEQHIRLIN